MNEQKKQYSDRMSYEIAPKYEPKNIGYLLPEWITNLKNYFGNRPDIDYSPAYR